jgi:predicted CopG family antitoxin
MGNKTISISDVAYSKLYKLKGKNESFTDVINRLTKRTDILDLAGVLSKSETKVMKSAIAELRK